jgi:hypothetical protein
MIIIVTPNGDKALTSCETGVLRIPFHQFVKESKTLLGVNLRHTDKINATMVFIYSIPAA